MSATTNTAKRAHEAVRQQPIWTLNLWELGERRLAVAATAVTALLLAWTRFAFLPSGPWEWDETLFARGILRFDLHAHFPHPPGFPLWLALGWLAKPLVSEPLRGLQLLSAACSVLTLWPLAALGRRAAPARVAATAALVFLMLPGVWLHAPRGFSATPAAFFALWAAALAVDGLGGRRATAFSLLVTASFLIRPIILPSLGLLWLAGALSVRDRRRLLPGIAIGAGATAAATAAMIALQGSWSRFAEAFSNHATRHARGLAENVAGFSGLGIVKGAGGEWVAISMLVLAGIGLVVWARRRGAGVAAAWAAVWLAGVAQLVWLQDRAYPRYAVPFQLAAAPLVAAGAAAAAPAAAGFGLAAIGAYGALRAYPLLVEQRDTLMAGWAALRFAAAAANRAGYELVVEPGLAPFTSYLQEVDKDRGRPWRIKTHLAPTPSAARTLPTSRYLVVTDRPERYLPPILGRTWRYSGQSVELEPLTQGRFHPSAVIENATLPVTGWQIVARDERNVPFVWGGTQASVLLPPLPAGTGVAMEVEPTAGPSALELLTNGRSALVLSGRSGRQLVHLPAGALIPERANLLAFTRPEAYAPQPGARPFALRLSGLRVEGGPEAWSAALADEAAAAAAGITVTAPGGPAPGVTLTGTYRPERFPAGVGTWTEPTARLRAPAGSGVVRLRAWAPRPTPAQLEIWSRGTLLAGPLTLATTPGQIELALAPELRGAPLELELRCDAYTPPSEPGAPKRQPLGVVLGGIAVAPAPDAPTGWRGAPDAAAGWVFTAITSGVWDIESFDGVAGAWTRPGAVLAVPAASGTVELTVLAPRPTAPRLEVWAAGRRLAGPFDPPPTPVTLAVPVPPDVPAARGLELELRCVPYVPAARGGSDTRALGVVLSHVAYVPPAAPAAR
jgi:hypothetical protein